LFCTDLEQAKRFFTRVLGGELIHGVDGFAEVRVAGIIIGLTVRPGRTTARNAEFPHYAFFAETEDFLPMVAWLRQNGVVTTSRGRAMASKAFSIFAIRREISSRCIAVKSKTQRALRAARSKAVTTRSTLRRWSIVGVVKAGN